MLLAKKEQKKKERKKEQKKPQLYEAISNTCEES